jgi:hypothetical protein
VIVIGRGPISLARHPDAEKRGAMRMVVASEYSLDAAPAARQEIEPRFELS